MGPSRPTICRAKVNRLHILHKFLLFVLKEVEQLRQEKLEIDQQLRSIHGSTTGPMPNFPPARRGMITGPEEGGGGRGGRGGQSRGRGRGRASTRHNAGNTITDYINNVENIQKRNGRSGGPNARDTKESRDLKDIGRLVTK